ncbi:hypothetical protein HYPBUDRAFT_152594 [Hyphopichia burtonii NRRL Y-1933]|uniref:Uncharacterized protein n=1 Tax=Hyphopichia burtonii NRRL Y-1933 TaxID=984485 RepID=A0A1E4RKL4_9ASCO|nr:hypothetical protein HYPBUDRAFT_152594 [Hyphopichia burtonii NRRL Y-1933]ODV67817.1 hypothetical protein HYPBUDRAFT_152594 [Hyphopichia burtonii NRRL Y-1933]
MIMIGDKVLQNRSRLYQSMNDGTSEKESPEHITYIPPKVNQTFMIRLKKILDTILCKN